MSFRSNRQRRGHEALDGRTQREIETIGADVRRRFGIGPTERVDAIGFFESLDDVYLDLGLPSLTRCETGVKEFEPGLEGKTEFNLLTGRIDVLISEQTYKDARDGKGHALFTIAHEAAHVILHGLELYRRASDPSRSLNRSTYPIFKDTEWQADSLAAVLIAPEEGVLSMHDEIGYISAIELKRRFGFSLKAAEYRIGEISRLNTEKQMLVI